MLQHDPVPWLMQQEGLPAVRARRSLCLERNGDPDIVEGIVRELADQQAEDGSFGNSLMKTAGVLNLLADLRPKQSRHAVEFGVDYLLARLQAQPGYERAKTVRPGSLQTPCDLCGFFGPYDDRNLRQVMADGAREMNFYREYEPLLGPKSPVRAVRRSSLDRAGPKSCYAWGLIPLAYAIQAVCRSGHSGEARLAPAVNALLGAQRASGGWCRNLGGSPFCSVHAVRALSAHEQLHSSEYAERALLMLRRSRGYRSVFGMIHVVSGFDSRTSRESLGQLLATVAERQQTDGSFGTPCAVERVAAVLAGVRGYRVSER